jgi:hypothetical protein
MIIHQCGCTCSDFCGDGKDLTPWSSLGGGSGGRQSSIQANDILPTDGTASFSSLTTTSKAWIGSYECEIELNPSPRQPCWHGSHIPYDHQKRQESHDRRDQRIETTGNASEGRSWRWMQIFRTVSGNDAIKIIIQSYDTLHHSSLNVAPQATWVCCIELVPSQAVG